jgi:hypothetical protein
MPARLPIPRNSMIVIGAVYTLTGAVQCAVQLMSFALGVTTITAKATVHAGNLSLILSDPFQLAMRDVALFPPGTGPCALLVQASVDATVERPVLGAETLAVPTFPICSPAPLTPCMAEVSAVEFTVVSLVTPACVSPGFAAIRQILASIAPCLTVFGLTALITPVVGAPNIAVSPLCISATTFRRPFCGPIAVAFPCCPALALFSSLTAFRPTLLAVGFCSLRSLLTGVTAWHIFRLRCGRCGQPERGGGKQRGHNSWIYHCVFSGISEWPRSGALSFIVGDAI